MNTLSNLPTNVVECKNLRESLGDHHCRGTLVPAAPPNFVAHGCGRYLGSITTSDGLCHYIFQNPEGEVVDYSGTAPVSLADAVRGASPTRLWPFADEVTSIVACQDMFVLFSPSERCVKFFYTPGAQPSPWTCSADLPAYPGFALVAEGASALSATIPPMSLADSYDYLARQLSDRDLSTVGGAVKEAYESLAASAMAAGVYFQPVLAAYQLLDRSGNVLYSSAPVLLAPTGGTQARGTITFNFSGGNTLQATSLSANTFRINVLAPATVSSTLANTVASLRVLVSPQIHPYNPAVNPDYTLTAHATQSLQLRVSLPGVGCGLIAENHGSGTRTLGRIIAGFDSLAYTALNLPRPFNGAYEEGTPIEVSHGSLMLPGKEVTAVQSLGPVTRASQSASLASKASLPGTFSCSGVCTVGNTVFYANPSITSFSGYNPLDYAAELDTDSHWHAFAEVAMADGSTRVVNVAQGSVCAPTSLSPVIVFPDANAVSLKFVVKCAAQVFKTMVPLTPVDGADLAIYVSPDFSPIRLQATSESFAVPSPRPLSQSYRGHVAVARMDSPTDIVTVSGVVADSITAMLPACNSSGSWDFGRRRVYVFSPCGIHMATTNTSLSDIAVSVIHGEGVDSPTLLAQTASGTFIVQGAVPVLRKLSAHKLTDMDESYLLPTQVSAIFHDPVRGELWCIPSPETTPSSPRSPSSPTASSVEACVICLGKTATLKSYTATVPPISAAFTTADGQVFGITAGGELYTLTGNEVTQSVDIKLAVAMKIPPTKHSGTRTSRFHRASALTVNASAADAQGTLSLSLSHLPNLYRSTCNLVAVRISGSLLAPLRLPLAPVVSSAPAQVYLEASVSPDFYLSHISID